MSDSQDRISRRQFIQTGAGMAALGLSGISLSGAQQKSRRPNILYVFSDMQRATSMACYGDPNVHTPALDGFAGQGARLDAAMSNTPVCCPHRASLMTGLYAHHHGVASNGVRFTRHARGFAEQFRDAGYVTGYAGKWHMPAGYGSEDSMPLGFPADQIGEKGKSASGHFVSVKSRDAHGREVETMVYKPTLLTDRTVRFIEEKSRGDKPWLFVLSWLPPHGPYKAPPEFRKHYEGRLQLAPNVPDGRPKEFASASLPDYYGMVESLDVEFKRILEALDRAGVAEDTIVCYSSDHGDMLGSHGYRAKRWPHEASARVPLLIRYPRAIRPGQVINDPFSTIDVHPTLAALAGVKPASGIDGVDYSPLLTGKISRPPRDYVYLEMAYAYVPWPGWRALRTREFSYARTVKGPWLLTNVIKDPHQLKNLVDDRASRALLEEMDKRLAALMKETGDSWDYRSTTGDVEDWAPGGQKERSQNLGVPWPGSEEAAKAKQAGAGGGRKARKRARRRATGA